jgi:hypothetical protein
LAWLSNAIYLGRAWLLDLKTLALKISWPGWPVDTKQPGEISWSGWPIERRSINLVGRIKFLFRLEFVYINLIPWLSNTLYLIFLFFFLYTFLSIFFLFLSFLIFITILISYYTYYSCKRKIDLTFIPFEQNLLHSFLLFKKKKLIPFP